jgi:hypothetical protein
MRQIVAALASLLWLMDANAQAPSGWYTSTVKYVYAGQAGGRASVAINLPANFGTCPTGGAPSQEFVMDPSNPFFKQMLMMIMTAYLTGKSVNVYTTGQCFSSGLLLTDVWLPM